MRGASVVITTTVLGMAVAGVAEAATISPGNKKVGAGSAAVSSCGALNGVAISWSTTANVVTTVVLTSLPVACIGGSLSLTLVGSGNASLAQAGPVTVAGTTQTLSVLTGSATATSVTRAYLSVVGP